MRLFLCLGLASLTAAFCPTDIAALVEDVLSDSALEGSRWGIQVHQLGDNPTRLYARNERDLMLPASNNKLFATAAALTLFGGNHVISTPVLRCDDQARKAVGAAVPLCVRGMGDATTTSDQVMSVATSLAAQLGQGTHVELMLDGQEFSGVPMNWQWGDFPLDYGAVPEAFAVDGNNFQVVVSVVGGEVDVQFNPPAIAEIVLVRVEAEVHEQSPQGISVQYDVADSRVMVVAGQISSSQTLTFTRSPLSPSLHFGAIFAAQLESGGLVVDSVNQGRCSAQCTVLVNFTSAKLSDSMHHCLKVSDNLYAELFMRNVGYATPNEGGVTGDSSYAHSIRAVRSVLESKLGLNQSNYFFSQDDGSGVSRQNLVSTSSLIGLLTAISELPDPLPALFTSFLPIAGVDGTLSNRFRGTPAQGILHAKTGSLNGVNALSGYVFPPNFDPVVFSIISNGAIASSSTVRAGIDAIAGKLAELEPCQSLNSN